MRYRLSSRDYKSFAAAVKEETAAAMAAGDDEISRIQAVLGSLEASVWIIVLKAILIGPHSFSLRWWRKNGHSVKSWAEFEERISKDSKFRKLDDREDLLRKMLSVYKRIMKVNVCAGRIVITDRYALKGRKVPDVRRKYGRPSVPGRWIRLGAIVIDPFMWVRLRASHPTIPVGVFLPKEFPQYKYIQNKVINERFQITRLPGKNSKSNR